MRLIVLTVMGLMAGLGLAAAIVALPVMANKGPQRATLVAPLGGAQEEQNVQGGGNPDGRGRAVVKVFEEQLCAKVKTGALESSSSKATLHLGMSGEKGPTVANLQEQAATTPLPESTTPTTTPATGTTTTTTGTSTATTVTTGTTTGTTGTTTGTTTPTTGTTTATAGTTGGQTGTTTTPGDTTLAQATTPQSTTVEQTNLSQSTASPTASASASASTASTSTATIHEHTDGCVAVPRALSLELLEHPRRFYVKVANGQSPEGAIRGQLQRSGNNDHRSADGAHRRGDADDD
jgi:hypothetical protein